jgi:RHS repeat-associated protein
VSNPIRFQGQYQDPETALHYNRYRYYEPKMARYVSRDPIGMQGGMNVYSYVNNAPVMRADPLGLWDAPFTNMPGVQERVSLGTHMMNNGESPEAVARAMAPPPRPVATGECKASIAIAAGAGLSGSVAVNEKSGVSKWGFPDIDCCEPCECKLRFEVLC